MKKISLLRNKKAFLNYHKSLLILIASFIFFCSPFNFLQSQSTAPALSFQGILKKATGEAVEDNTYNMKFRLYTQETGGMYIWEEVQDDVEVTSGIYSTVLGNTESLDSVEFDQIYYLGVTVGGGSEMLPRIQLTSAPYAMSLIGVSNKFPSTGLVRTDSIRVKGGVIADNGWPGANGNQRNGYGFLNDRDSGMFSLTNADGTNAQVSLFVNSVEEVKVRPDSTVINGKVYVDDLEIDGGGNINYNGLDDWRLLYFEDFKNGANGWQWYGPNAPENLGWNNGTAGGTPIVAGASDNYSGRYIIPGDGNAPGNPWENRRVLKKEYNLTNMNYEFIKIKFKYYVLDTWDDGADADRAWAAIAQTNTGTQLRVGWTVEEKTWVNYGGHLPTAGWNAATNFGGGSSSDYSRDAEMTFFKNTATPNSFWLMFGAALTDDAPSENFGVGMIEIWVK